MTAYIFEVSSFPGFEVALWAGMIRSTPDGDDERGEALAAAEIVVLVGIEGGTFVLLYLPWFGLNNLTS